MKFCKKNSFIEKYFKEFKWVMLKRFIYLNFLFFVQSVNPK